MGEKFPLLYPIVKTNYKNIENDRTKRPAWGELGLGNRDSDQGDNWSARPKKLTRAGQNRGTGKLTRGEDRSARPKKLTKAGKDWGTETPTKEEDWNARPKKAGLGWARTGE